MSVLKAVERDLKEVGPLANSGLAEVARQMARELDGNNSATSKSMCASRLMECLAALRDLAPDKKARDRVDELASKRAARRATG